MTPADDFALSPEERARLDTPLFRNTSEDHWERFAGGIHLQVVKAYTDGEITLERALQVMRSCSIGCGVAQRIFLLALTARRALENPPAERPGKPQPNPTWVRYSAGSLVQMFRGDRPDEPIAPNEHNNWTTDILRDALDWLVTIGLCERVSPRTLYGWYLEAQKNGFLQARSDNTQSNSTSTA